MDKPPGLAQVIGDSAGNRFVHSPRGMHAAHDSVTWAHPLTDGLGSVRGYVDTNGEVLSTVHYSDYGVPDAPIVGPAFTGEWRDVTGVQYHRARYLSPELGSCSWSIHSRD